MIQIEILGRSVSTGTVFYVTEGACFAIAPPYAPLNVTEIKDLPADFTTNRDYDRPSARIPIRSYEELKEWAADEAAPTAIHRSENLPLHQPQQSRHRQSRPDEVPTLF